MLFSKEEFLGQFRRWRKWIVVLAAIMTAWDVGLVCVIGGACRDSLWTSYLIVWLAVLPIAAMGAILHILLKPIVLWLKERHLLLPVCIGLTILMIYVWWDFFKILLLIWIGFAAFVGSRRLRGESSNDNVDRENELNWAYEIARREKQEAANREQEEDWRKPQ